MKPIVAAKYLAEAAEASSLAARTALDIREPLPDSAFDLVERQIQRAEGMLKVARMHLGLDR